MMNSLSRCLLFKDLAPGEPEQLLSRCGYLSKTYAKGDVIALKGTRYNQLLLLIEGRVTAETTDRSQNILRVEHITAPAVIAPTYLFAEESLLPVNIMARSAVHLLLLSREELCSLLEANRQVLVNYLEIVSTPNKFISEKVVYLTYKTIKGKFANFLLDKMAETGSSSFRNTLTQREMADMFGVTRPALARAIGELVDEGTIFVKGKEIKILFSEKLKQYARN